jgi:hypothetical protein
MGVTIMVENSKHEVVAERVNHWRPKGDANIGPGDHLVFCNP